MNSRSLVSLFLVAVVVAVGLKAGNRVAGKVGV